VQGAVDCGQPDRIEMSISYYVLTTWLLLSAVTLALPHGGEPPSGLPPVARIALAVPVMIAALIFQLNAFFALEAWAVALGAAVVIALLMTFTRTVLGRSRHKFGWGVACAVPGITLAVYPMAAFIAQLR
jgi:hypothetical protein